MLIEQETAQQNKNTIRHAHDRVFKASMEYPEVAKVFFQSTLPAKLVAQINWDYFILQPPNHVNDWHKELIVDVLYKTQVVGKTAFFYLLTNHQSTVNPLMAFHIQH